MISTILNRDFYAFVLCLGVLWILMITTSPGRGSVVVLLWFAAFGFAVFWAYQLFARVFALNRSKLNGALFSAAAVFAVGLSSLNQLTVSDVTLVVAVLAVAIYFLNRKRNN